jgi:hypothetical protein
MNDPNPVMVKCECGETEQSAEGWKAQVLFTDVSDTVIKDHFLPPQKCVEFTCDDGDLE